MKLSPARVLWVAIVATIGACGSRTSLLGGGGDESEGGRSDTGGGGVESGGSFETGGGSSEAGGGGVEAGDGGAGDAFGDGGGFGDETGGEAGDGAVTMTCVGTIPFKEIGPAFGCGMGKSMTCWGGTQYCFQGGGGPPPGTSFARCQALPCACEGDLSCACVDAGRSGACSCSDVGGQVTVSCAFP